MKGLYSACFSSKPVQSGLPNRPSVSVPSLSTQGFRVTVQHVNGQKIHALVSRGSTINNLKGVIAKYHGTPVEVQRLIFAGVQLKDEKTLAEYDIGPASTVHLVEGRAGC
ncbi:ubiquitin-related domain-containing protein [Cadophora sp. MPI-SDFR-AT-0126]|nr:ubiquitin-related domain-containing protein [Leotiomycetes sp. MPI-SDFR-AT-0126]